MRPPWSDRLVRALPLLPLLPLLLALATRPLGAQSTRSGAIVGRLADEQGVGVAGGSIVLTPAGRDSAADASRRATTDDAGTFRLNGLRPGVYELRAQRIGYRTTIYRDVEVRAQLTTEVRVTVRRTPVALTPVIVAAPAVTIRRSDTELGTVISTEEIELLPVGLDLRALVAFTPGARVDAVWGGASAQANSYQLDGLAANHPGIGGELLAADVHWIEALEVKGLGGGAELGNFQGGVINVVTKSGTNDFRAVMRVNAETHRLNGSNLRLSEAVPELAGRREYAGEVGGPLVRDRLFYFAAGQLVQRDTRVRDQVTGGTDFAPGDEEREEHKLFGKLSWQASSADLLTLTGFRAAARAEHAGLTGFETLDATRRLDAPADLMSLAWQRRGDRRRFELRASAGRSDERLTPYAGIAVPGISTFRTVDDRRYQNALFDERRRARSAAVGASWGLDFTTSGAAHALEVGAEYDAGTWRDRRERTAGMTWRPPTSARPATYPFVADDPRSWPSSGIIPVATGGEVDLDAAVENAAVYVQDHIALGARVTVSPGLRLGRWVGRLRGADGGRFTAARDVGLDPRLGVTVDLTGRNETVAKAHWGRYHQGMFGQLFDRAAGAEVFTAEQLWYYRGPSFTDPATSFTATEWDALVAAGQLRLMEEQALNVTGPAVDYRQPYVDQWVVGVERTFGGRWKAEARYVNRRNRNLVALVDRNLATNHSAFDAVAVFDGTRQVRDASGTPLLLPELFVPNDQIIAYLRERAARRDGLPLPPGFVLADTARLTWDPDYVLTTAPGAYRRLDQLQLALTTRAPRWTASASAVVSRLRGNVASVTSYDEARGRSPGPWVRPNERIAFDGTLDGVSELELKLLATGELPWGLRGGAFFTLRSGDAVTPTFTHSGILFDYVSQGTATIPIALTVPLAGQEVFAEARGAYKYPARALLDLHLERAFAARGAELALVLDVFNVLGEHAVTRMNTRLDASGDPLATSAFGAARSREAPRTVRLGTAVTF